MMLTFSNDSTPRNPGRIAAAVVAVTGLLLGLSPAAAAQQPAAGPGSSAIQDAAVTASAAPGYDPDAAADYVALGDSFAALGSTTTPVEGPLQCLRTSTNYPSVLAASEDLGRSVDATCGGAKVDAMYAPQRPGVPPQLEALRPETSLVTLSVGGNDMGFGEVVGCLLVMSALPGPSCEDRLDGVVDENLAELAPRLDTLYADIAERSPDARVVATEYMPLLPEEGGCAFTDMFGPGDIEWARDVTERINTAVRAAAERNGATSVRPTDTVDRSACAAPAERWTEFTGVESQSIPMHPTALGQEAMAGAVAEVM